MNGVTGQWKPEDVIYQQLMLTNMIKQLISKISNACAVQVVACSNNGGVSAVGTVTVQPMIDQVDGAGVRYAHGELYQVPYSRLQGGNNAMIIDPESGDLGQVIFMSRDTTALRSAALGEGLDEGADTFGPATFRQYDWADGWYVAPGLNAVPENFLQFINNMINVVALAAIGLTAPAIGFNASVGVTATTPVLSTTQNLSAGTGASGVFTTPTGQTITVQNGIIVNIN